MTAPRPSGDRIRPRKYSPNNPFVLPDYEAFKAWKAKRFADVEGGSSSAKRMTHAERTWHELRGDLPEQRERGDAINKGFSFGFADEMEGALAAMQGRDYTATRDAARARIDANAAKHPGLELAGGAIASAVPIGGAAGVLGEATSWLSRIKAGIAAGAKAGAIGGAIYGAGNADELEDVPGAAARGGARGLVVGAAVPALVVGGRAMTSREAARAVEATLPKVSAASGRAARAIVPAVREEVSSMTARDALDFLLARSTLGKAYKAVSFAGRVAKRMRGVAETRTNALADELDAIPTSTVDAQAAWPPMQSAGSGSVSAAPRSAALEEVGEVTGLEQLLRASVEQNRMPYGVTFQRHPATGCVTYGWAPGGGPTALSGTELRDALEFYTKTDAGRGVPGIGMRLRAEAERRLGQSLPSPGSR